MRARARDEGGQAFEEDEGLEGDVGGAVGPGVSEREEHAAALVEGGALVGDAAADGGGGDVSQEGVTLLELGGGEAGAGA